MNLPEPVKKFLQGDTSLEILVDEAQYQPKDLGAVRKLAMQLYSEKINPYYNQFDLKLSTGAYNFLAEPLKNARFHGGENITVGLYLTQHAMVASFSDGGDYFKQSAVKNAWENKQSIAYRHKVDVDGIGYGAGVEIIYCLSDVIHVESGTLYLGALTAGILFLDNLS